jgi:hypothetical protein
MNEKPKNGRESKKNVCINWCFLRRIWLNLMAQYLIFFGSFTVFTIFRIYNFFGLSSTDETWLVEMHIWCIEIGIVLVLYSFLFFLDNAWWVSSRRVYNGGRGYHNTWEFCWIISAPQEPINSCSTCIYMQFLPAKHWWMYYKHRSWLTKRQWSTEISTVVSFSDGIILSNV